MVLWPWVQRGTDCPKRDFFLTPLNAFKQTGWNENRKLKAEGTALNKVMCKPLRK